MAVLFSLPNISPVNQNLIMRKIVFFLYYQYNFAHGFL